ncbi:MAG TPA: M3 family metallopeptidase [Terracidiphilus sp.]|nr:M3 family metallopeptidase [Terracidiphilus sp.]
MSRISMLTAAGAIALTPGTGLAQEHTAGFGPSNPFYAPSPLPFHAPPFDRIKDADFQPAIEAGIAQKIAEIQEIADNSAAPTFENTIVAIERAGQLYNRATQVFDGLISANSDPVLEQVRTEEAPKRAALRDALYLNGRLFKRVAAIYDRRHALHLDPESLRLVEYDYKKFVHAGAKLSDADKEQLRKLNEEEASLSAVFTSKLQAATKSAAYATTDKAALAGLSDAQLAAAAQAAHSRGQQGWVLPLQNTTQQPILQSLSNRATRKAVFKDSWTRAERGGPNDTRDTIARLAQVRALKAKLLGYDSYAAWKLEDQMAGTPEAAIKFMNALVPASTAKAREEGSELQAIIDKQHGGFRLRPWDWNFYAEQLRKAKYNLDEEQTRPYFELNNVLHNGVFYAAHQLYGLSFKQRNDIPVYSPGVQVYEVFDAGGKPLALWYCDYFKRDNKDGGAWMSGFVSQSRLLGTLPVIYNVANFPPPAPGEPALLSFTDVTTMFHEFGHALHGMMSTVEYPSLSGTDVPRDFVEFPSQFNEHWALNPVVFRHYARHYKTGAPMPAELAAKIRKARTFNQGYLLTEMLSAAELDMQWHTLPADAPLENPDTFETEALEKTHLALADVPPRYRSSYFMHIWSNGYAAGYYAYLWSEMLDDNAYQWFEDHGGLTRANGDRFRRMILSRGNTEDPATMYEAWFGGKPGIGPMLKERGLEPEKPAR